MLSPNVIIPFSGNHADVPSGFARVTDLDGKYPKGYGAEVINTSGGAATHTHTSPGHTHSLAPHTHTATLPSPGTSGGTRSSGGDLPVLNHTHSVTTDNPSSTTSSSTAVTYGSCSNDPPYYTVIFIKSNGYSFIPPNGMVIRESTTRPGMTFHSASAGKYLKGAGTGANAGGTGGSVTNVHNITHGHTIGAHTHTFTSSTLSPTITSPDTWEMVRGAHNHSGTTGNSSSDTVNNNTDDLTTTETVEPSHRKLNPFINDGASGVQADVGDIALWLDSVSTIPPNWLICDGTNDTPNMTDVFLKNNTTATSTSTGGSNTHTHAAQGHTHTGASHTHSVPSVSHTAGNGNSPGGSVGDGMLAPSPHASTTTSSTALSLSSANTTADSSGNQPAYLTVAYIQMKFSIIGGGFLFNLL